LNDRIGELLVQKNLLSEEQLRRAKEEARTSGTRIGYQITKLGFVEEEKVAEAVSNQYGVPTIELDDFEVDSEVIALIPEDVANKHTILPVNRAGSTLIVAMSDPSNIFAIDDVKFLTGYNVEVVVAAEEAIRRAIDRYYDKGADLDEVMAGFDDQEFEVVGDETRTAVVAIAAALGQPRPRRLGEARGLHVHEVEADAIVVRTFRWSRGDWTLGAERRFLR